MKWDHGRKIISDKKLWMLLLIHAVNARLILLIILKASIVKVIIRNKEPIILCHSLTSIWLNFLKSETSQFFNIKAMAWLWAGDARSQDIKLQWRHNGHDGVLWIVYSTVCSCTDQRKHQSSASLDFVKEIRRWPGISPHKGPVTRKMFLLDDLIMIRDDLGLLSPT